MKFCRFFAVAAAILLCFALFCGNFACHFAYAEVVHAYRKPSESDLQWLLGGDPFPATESLGIVQVGFTDTAASMLVPRCGPCSPVSVPIPMPSIPPPPQTVNSRMNAGLVSDVDGVVNIAPIIVDSPTSVVQMTGERLPPPLEVPKETSLAVPLVDFSIEPLPMPDKREYFRDDSYFPTDPCRPVTDFGAECSNDYMNKPRFYTPDMLGSSAWLTGYSVGENSTSFTLPTMLLTRPNVVERFNASVQNRIWADYRHWNHAVSLGSESRAVEQFSFGLEAQVLRQSSVELRVPLISQFSSKQMGNTSVELGNVSVFTKQVLCQNARWTISGGMGATLPTAEDWRASNGARLKNNAYYLVSFLGIQWHPNNNTFGQFVLQTDMPMEKNELIFGTARQKIDGQQVIRTGLQLGHWIYRADHDNRPCRLGTFAEINYAVITDGSPLYHLNGVDVSAFETQKSTLTAAVGMPMIFGKLTCTNSLFMPISGSRRPFSVGYGFSLSQQF